jgi:HEAT repeat protein
MPHVIGQSNGRSSAGAADIRQAMQQIVARLPEGSWRALQEAGLRRLLDLGVRVMRDLTRLARDDGAGLDDRLAACWFLGQLRRPEAVPALCQALRHGPVRLRLEACYSLLELGDPRAVACLRGALSRDADMDIRKAAAYALGWLRDRSAVPALVRTLENRREDASVRGMAAEQLGRLQDPAAIGALRRALKDDHMEVRFWAAYALGEYGPPDVIGDLDALAAWDAAEIPGQGSVRDEAIEAIESIRERSAARG